MKPFYQDAMRTIYNKDCRDMSELLDESVQCVVTSPPYWGLRKYSGVPDLIWGGDKDCEHSWNIRKHVDTRGIDGSNLTGRIPYKEGEARINYSDGFCQLCGAWKGSYGLEPTPEMYIQHTIEILREIRRVLRKDGVVFWNIGDGYAANRSYQVTDTKWRDVGNTEGSIVPEGLKPKDLCLIPFRVAIAAQEDGWWIRSVIIWNKPNPMPESVTDRPTNSHDYILMLTKSSKYYWDADAVREENKPESIDRYRYSLQSSFTPGEAYPNEKREEPQNWRLNPNGRNLRSVWSFPTQPYPDAHFAVFPEKLPETCIKAATSEKGCCSKCGAPWERVVEKTPQNVRSHKLAKGKVKDAVDGNNPDMAVGGGFSRTGVQFEWGVKTIGWQPTCKCKAQVVPCTVLDPFAGAGTTLYIGAKLGRKVAAYELSEEYCEFIVERNSQSVLIENTVPGDYGSLF